MMKTLLTLIVSLSLMSLVRAQELANSPTPDQPGNVDGFEDLPLLKASEILRDVYLNGPHHQVREDVPTYSGADRYMIDSHFGLFEADGNEMLVRRVHEINAIAKLKDVSRTDQYKDALVQAAQSPLNAAKHIIKDPVGTIKNAPKGIMKFMNRAGESIKSIGQKDGSDDGGASKAKEIIGFSDAKRKEALDLGVDPYSSNTVLQEQLDEISWAAYAGKATFSIATMPIGGAAGIALTTTNVSGALENVLREKSPNDLKIMNRKALIAMGASEKEANQLLDNDAFSPSAQTAFVLNLKTLDGVENRRAFIRLAGQTSSSEPDAIFCVQTAGLMSKLHQGEMPLAKIALNENFPICVGKDGTVVVALQWDYAAWTPLAKRFADDLQRQNGGKGKYLVAISGVVSPTLRQQLESRGFKVEDRLSPGPLK